MGIRAEGVGVSADLKCQIRERDNDADTAHEVAKIAQGFAHRANRLAWLACDARSMSVASTAIEPAYLPTLPSVATSIMSSTLAYTLRRTNGLRESLVWIQ